MEDNDNHPSLPSNYVTLAQLQERWLKQKEKEKQLQETRQQQQQIPKLASHPSLPSNYVTLAQLQERSLKQKKEEKQLQETRQQQQQIPKLAQHNPREDYRGRRPETQQQAWRAIHARPTGFGWAAVKRPPAQSEPKNPKISESNRIAVQVSRETNDSVEAKVDIEDGNNGQYGKKKESKRRKTGKRKPRADGEKKKLVEDATANKEKKRLAEGESLEAKVDIRDGNNGHDGKKKESMMNLKTRKRKPRADGEKKKLAEDATADKEKKRLAENATLSIVVGNKDVTNPDVQKVDEKTETKIELNGSNRNNLMVEVQQKLGAMSMKSENEKQNSRIKTYYSSHGSQRNHGGRSFRIRPYGDRISDFGPYGGRIRAREDQRRRFDQKIWVRKSGDSDGNVNQNEVSLK